MNSRIATLPALLVLTFAAAQCSLLSVKGADAGENRGQFSDPDYKFAATAARGGTYEVALGNLAQKSYTEAVKSFGQRMVEDHGKAGKQLSEIATHKGATLPSSVSEEQQTEIDHLGLLSGQDFDRAYMAAMVRAHKSDLTAFKTAAKEVRDEDLRKFAANMVPIIQDHLSMAQALEENLKSGMPMSK